MKVRADPSYQRLVAWRQLIRTIASKGFVKKSEIRYSFVKRVTDPMFVNPPVREYTLGGVGHINGGRFRFSTIDLLGSPLYRSKYLVVNDEKFRSWASMKLEAQFRAKNPHPDKRISAAFTHYMHDYNLHWSGCKDGHPS